jgi:hypothetical protein
MCRTVFLPKEYDPDDAAKVMSWRPIGITGVWYRLIGKIINIKLQESVGPSLQKLGQIAIGVTDGCSIGGKIVDSYLEKDESIVQQIDIKNAFNSIGRDLILEGIQEICPSLKPMFQFIYGKESLLVNNNNIIGTCKTGTLQGDTLSMLYYCIGMHVIMRKIRNMFESNNLSCNDNKDGTLTPRLVSYCDDLWILGNYSNINQLKEVAIQCITEYGLAVNIDKCKQYDRASNGIVLGTAIGTTEFINNHIENVIETVETMIELINEDKLHPKNRLMFIKYCINTIPVFTARNHLLSTHQSCRIDKAIDKGISGILKRDIVSDIYYSHIIRGLPQYMGGISIPRYSTNFHKILFDTLQSKSKTYIANHYPDIAMKEIEFRIDETGKTNDSDTTCQRDRHHKILQETYRLLLDKYLMNPLTVTAYALLQSNSFSNSSYHLDLNGYSFD